MKSAIIVLAAASALFIFNACSSDTPSTPTPTPTGDAGHTSPYPDCQIILDECHEFDIGEGAIHDCHEVGHDAKSNADCATKKAGCVALCRAAGADAGGSGDAGAGDSGDGGHDHDE